MSIVSDSIRLVTLEIRSEHDVVLCRQRARQLAAGLGFDAQDQVRIATAVSEIARNAYQYARGGRLEFALTSTPHSAKPSGRTVQTLTATVRDQGPGIPNLKDVLDGRVGSKTGLGVGVIGTKKLMDRADFTSSPSGTTVTLGMHLPASSPHLTPADVQRVVDKLSQQKATSAMEEIQNQNQELMRLMEDLQRRQQEIENANRELDQTNAGVLALYDELETLHRVGMMLAAKVDLKELIHALIDATTELTGAEWGAFFTDDEPGRPYRLQATAGPRSALLEGYQGRIQQVTAEEFGPQQVINCTRQSDGNFSISLPSWLEGLQSVTRFESCLAVPVIDAEGQMIGALILGSATPGTFSERGERIMTSIAVQAAVAVEKARLFDKVRASNSAKDRFLAMLSHELRTPLTPVVAIISSLNANPALPEMFREDIQMVLRNVQLETRIIDDLLDFHRLITGKFILVTKPVNVHSMVKNVLQICRAEIEEKSHTIVLELDAPRPVVSGEAARIQQVLWNLLKNAIKFTRAGGIITIRSEAQDGQLLVHVIDNGKGMSSAVMANLFIPFEQGDSNVTVQFGGLGLGLVIAKAFIEKHGGTITAFSEGESRGSRLTISLPLLEEAPEVAPSTAHGITISSVPVKRVSANILLVDDHADTLTAMSRVLRAAGHTVTTASSCATAMEAINETINLVISDVGLRDGSGHDLIRMIRQSSQVPAIAVSGYGMEADVIDSKNAGFHVHITKPLDVPKLLFVIQQLMNGEVPS